MDCECEYMVQSLNNLFEYFIDDEDDEHDFGGGG